MSTDREALIQRLKDCQRRIDDMCKEGRPPKMSIPAQPDYDDDLVICQVISDVIAALSAQGGEQTDTVSVPRAQMREWAEFWGHYSSVNEGCQDDMNDERHKTLGEMLAAAKEGK